MNDQPLTTGKTRNEWQSPGNWFGMIALVAFFILLSAGLSSAGQMRAIFGKTTYYILWLLFLLWLNQLRIFLQSIEFSFKRFLHDYWPVLTVALALTIMTAIAIPPHFRVLSDEANLASISRSMLFTKSVYNYTIGKYYYHIFNPIIGELDKRPMLYPFFAHLFHIPLGYDVKNLFLLNLSLLFVLLSSAGIVVSRLFRGKEPADSWGVWVSAMLLLLACPIITNTATSAGFDFFAAIFFGLVFLVLAAHLKNPSEEGFAFLWMSLILLSHTRYESFIFFVIVIIGLLVTGSITKEFVARFRFIYWFTPLAVLPLIFQRIITAGSYENPVGVPAFSIGHLITNTKHFFSAIADFSCFYPYPNLLIWLALGLIPVMAWYLILGNGASYSREKKLFILFVVTSLSVYLGIVLLYYLGDPKHPTAARFFTLPVAALALLPVAAHRIWPRLITRWLLILGSLGMFLFYFPVTIEDRFTQTLEIIRETEHSLTFLDRLKNRNILVIADRPGIFTANGYGAVNFDYANSNKKLLLTELRNNLYTDIVVFQQISYGDKKPLASQRLDAEFVLGLPAAEHQITGVYSVRISFVDRARATPDR